MMEIAAPQIVAIPLDEFLIAYFQAVNPRMVSVDLQVKVIIQDFCQLLAYVFLVLCRTIVQVLSLFDRLLVIVGNVSD
jgi:hypothetical protein